MLGLYYSIIRILYIHAFVVTGEVTFDQMQRHKKACESERGDYAAELEAMLKDEVLFDKRKKQIEIGQSMQEYIAGANAIKRLIKLCRLNEDDFSDLSTITAMVGILHQ